MSHASRLVTNGSSCLAQQLLVRKTTSGGRLDIFQRFPSIPPDPLIGTQTVKLILGFVKAFHGQTEIFHLAGQT